MSALSSQEENTFRARKTKDQQRRIVAQKSSRENDIISTPQLVTSPRSKFAPILSKTKILLQKAKVKILQSRVMTRKQQQLNEKSVIENTHSYMGNGMIFTFNLDTLCGYGFYEEDTSKNRFFAVIGRVADGIENGYALSILPCTNQENPISMGERVNHITVTYNSTNLSLNGFINYNRTNLICFEHLHFDELNAAHLTTLTNANIVAIVTEQYQARLALSIAMEQEEDNEETLDALIDALRWVVEYTNVTKHRVPLLYDNNEHEKNFFKCYENNHNDDDDDDDEEDNGDVMLVRAARVRIKELVNDLVPDLAHGGDGDFKDKRSLLQLKPFILSFTNNTNDVNDDNVSITMEGTSQDEQSIKKEQYNHMGNVSYQISPSTTPTQKKNKKKKAKSLVPLVNLYSKFETTPPGSKTTTPTNNFLNTSSSSGETTSMMMNSNHRINRKYLTDNWKIGVPLSSWVGANGKSMKTITKVVNQLIDHNTQQTNDDDNEGRGGERRITISKPVTTSEVFKYHNLELEMKALKRASKILITLSGKQTNDYMLGWKEPLDVPFEVRGSSYLQNNIKILSKTPLIPLLGVDVFHSPKRPTRSPRNRNNHISRAERREENKEFHEMISKKASKDIGHHSSSLLQKLQKGDVVTTEGFYNKQIAFHYLNRLMKINKTLSLSSSSDGSIQNNIPPILVFNFLLPFGNLTFYSLIPEFDENDIEIIPIEEKNDKNNKCAEEEEEEEIQVKNKNSKLKLDKSSTINQTGLKLLRDYIRKDDDYRNSRLKLCVRVEEGPWLVRSAVRRKRPAKLGEHLDVSYTKTDQLFEVNIDVTRSRLGNHIASTVKPFLNNVVMDFAFILEGQSSQELPENVLTSVRIIKGKINDWPYLPTSTNPTTPISLSSSVRTSRNNTPRHSKNNKEKMVDTAALSSSSSSSSSSTSSSVTSSPLKGSKTNQSDHYFNTQEEKEEEQVEEFLKELDLSDMNISLHVQDLCEILLQFHSLDSLHVKMNDRINGSLPSNTSFKQIKMNPSINNSIALESNQWLNILQALTEKSQVEGNDWLLQQCSERMLILKDSQLLTKEEEVVVRSDVKEEKCQSIVKTEAQTPISSTKNSLGKSSASSTTKKSSSVKKKKTPPAKKSPSPFNKSSSTSQPLISSSNDMNSENESTKKTSNEGIIDVVHVQVELIHELDNEVIHNQKDDITSSLVQNNGDEEGQEISLRDRLESAFPLAPSMLPGVHSRIEQNNMQTCEGTSHFFDSHELVGVGLSEELSSSNLGGANNKGTEVMVNSEGAVFFLFFKEYRTNNEKIDQKEQNEEVVVVLKFSGTDVRTRSEGFANQIAVSFGIHIPCLNLMLKGSKDWQQLKMQILSLKKDDNKVSIYLKANLEKLLLSFSLSKVALSHQFIKGIGLLECFKQLKSHNRLTLPSTPSPIPSSSNHLACFELAKQIGICLISDLLLRNSDRFCCRLLNWRGNIGNVILTKKKRSITCHQTDDDNNQTEEVDLISNHWLLTAIDTTCPRAPPISATKTDPENYRQILFPILKYNNKTILNNQEENNELKIKLNHFIFELTFGGFGYEYNNYTKNERKALDDDENDEYFNKTLLCFQKGVFQSLQSLVQIESILIEIQEKVRKLMAGVTKSANKLLTELNNNGEENDNNDNKPKNPQSTPTSLRLTSSSDNSDTTISKEIPVSGLTKKLTPKERGKTPTINRPKNSPLGAVREINEKFLNSKSSIKETEFVLQWQKKFSSAAVEINSCLTSLIHGTSDSSNVSEPASTSLEQFPFVFNGFLEDDNNEAEDEKEKEELGLQCVEHAFEFHTRLKHLVPRAKLLRTIADEASSSVTPSE